ncbi:hypothetical protein [Thalassospira tepidiphila]|uniref:hypothetical protein n=1 Tax=Thalassospira tepidiphila TaxID=393657 RepID=UPI0030C65CE0
MIDLHATIRLRPTRIALLVRPTDLTSIRKFMRICCCMWGGRFNPIIPVFRSAPPAWRNTYSPQPSGKTIAQGYLNFFEPDAYVEAEPGLLERCGLDAFKDKNSIGSRAVSLNRMLQPESYRSYSELAMGHSITDALHERYERERQFVLRDKNEGLYVKEESANGLVEAMFGLYPSEKASKYFYDIYHSVFNPSEVAASPETWRKVYQEHAETPLFSTSYKIELDRGWQNDPIVYVFNPESTLDLIDLWNIRLESSPVLPVPITWWNELVKDINEFIRDQYRPLQGNPHGIMHNTTIELSRSLSEDQIKEVLAQIDQNLPDRSWAAKLFRNEIWRERRPNVGPKYDRLNLRAAERRTTLEIKKQDYSMVEFASLQPSFATIAGGGHHTRWINEVDLTSTNEVYATSYPFNVNNPFYPRLTFGREAIVIGRSGWSIAQSYVDSTTSIELPKQEDAVISYLVELGFEAKLSEPGHIAKQVLHHIGGLWGIYLLKHQETLRLLNEMAGRRRRHDKENYIDEELFGPRAKPANRWVQLVQTRKQADPTSRVSISKFTDCSIIRLGTTTKCPSCTEANWHDLDQLSYKLTCERCLATYPFPQGTANTNDVLWSYRVIGPFAVHDYARGSYGALLAINTLSGYHRFENTSTFSPALSIKLPNGELCEVDYFGWITEKLYGEKYNPRIVIGEAKSFGDGELIKKKDISQIKKVATYFPDAVIVITVLRDKFTATETDLIRSLVKWTNRFSSNRHPTNPVILLTGIELFGDYDFEHIWSTAGEEYAPFANYHHCKSLEDIARSTQKIHLG